MTDPVTATGEAPSIEAVALRESAGRNLHEKIANALGVAIVGGEHPPGRALPTEMELCARLSVSRSALREAFKLLAAKRLIVSRQKIGTLVRLRAEWNMLDPEVLAWHLQANPTDAFVSGLFEVRQIVEPQAAALAAERRTPHAVARIEQALLDMEARQGGEARQDGEARQNAVGDLADADLRFHQGILDATGNYFLASFGAVIESSLVASFQLSWHGSAHTPASALRQHHGVLTAIRLGRGPEAHAVMTELLRAASEDVRENLVRRKQRAAETADAD